MFWMSKYACDRAIRDAVTDLQCRIIESDRGRAAMKAKVDRQPKIPLPCPHCGKLFHCCDSCRPSPYLKLGYCSDDCMQADLPDRLRAQQDDLGHVAATEIEMIRADNQHAYEVIERLREERDKKKGVA